jgi:hypothetical protein
MRSAPPAFLPRFFRRACALLPVSRARQLQPQPPIPQQGPAAMPFPLGEASAEPFFARVFAGALNTESCRVCRTLAHFGHAILVFLASTIRSYRAPQSSQRYSYMGMSGSAP